MEFFNLVYALILDMPLTNKVSWDLYGTCMQDDSILYLQVL